MSDNKQTNKKIETVADILEEMRSMGNYQRYSGDHAHALADRIEAAWKHERAKVEADALEAGGIVEAGRNNGNAAAMREALEFADRELRMATEDDRYGEDLVYLVGCMRSVAAVCRAVLAKPPRNCDVGTAEEQYKRFRDYCYRKRCESLIAPNTLGSEVAFDWAQMPYEAQEGGAR